MQWTIGDVRVTRIQESLVTLPLELLYPEYDPVELQGHEHWLQPYVAADGTLGLSTHALVLESEGKIILVDTCVGTREVAAVPDMSNQPSTFLADLESAGFPRDAIDYVVCTHLHIDHVGCNTVQDETGAWVPTFPNARYLFSRPDYEHWDSGAEGAAWTFDSAVKPVYEAKAADLVEMTHVVTSEVRLVPSPGHSPGHVCVAISSNGEEAVITGDLVHNPVQYIEPNWRMFLDADPELAARTRKEFIARYANSSARIFGSHFPADSTGFLEIIDGKVQFVPEPTQA
ncbi:MBL fold metallo-hydrolase [Nocardia sp. CA-135953]|uniref:MBL fold metallo-hydrolase n=1 Tax=Nocardia sp. CA-135953 TaxID=3239978 RepID=UPI003D966755